MKDWIGEGELTISGVMVFCVLIWILSLIWRWLFLTVWRKPESPSEENPQQANFLELGSDRVEFELTQWEIMQPESAHLILLYNWRPTNQFQWVNNFCEKGTFNVLKFDTYDHRGLYTPLTFRTIKIYSSHYYWGFLR